MNATDLAPVLETERLVLRPHRIEDFEASAAMWADLAVVKKISGIPSTPEASWARLLRHAGHWALLGFGYWVVEAKDDARFIGEVGFADQKRDMTPALGDYPEAGWVLNASEHGRGFATEAVLCAHHWADQNREWERTVCILDPDHVASMTIAAKAGYIEDGVGDYRDRPTLIMSRSK